MSSPRPTQRRSCAAAAFPLVLATPASLTPAPAAAAVRRQVSEGALHPRQAAYVYPEISGRMAVTFD